MKAVWVVLLAGVVLSVTTGPAVAAVAGDDGAVETEPAETQKATKEGGEKGPEAPSDDQLVEGLRKAADESGKQAEEQKEAEEAEEAPKRPPTPFGRKLEEMEKLVRRAEELKAKIPDLEAKVNAAIAKLTDGSRKPVETKTLQQELAENRPSKAAKTYRDLTLTIAREYEKAKAPLLQAYKSGLALEKMRTGEEDLKVTAEAATVKAKEQIIEVLTTLVGVYERIHDAAHVTACYKQILMLDKENAAARAYFKELAEKAKREKEEGKSGSGGSYTPSSYDSGRRR